MALKPLAEQPLTEEPSEELSFLITQQTTVEGAQVEAIRRANLAQIVNLLENKLSINKKNGTIISRDPVTEDHDFSTPYEFDNNSLSAMPKQGDLIIDQYGNAYTAVNDGVDSEDGFHINVLLKYEGRIVASGSVSTDAVLYTPQTPTPEKQAQARANIGAIGGYYSTDREEIGVSHENINTAYIWGLYDALMAECPDNVQKIPIQSDDGTFTNYVYEVSTGEYCPTVKTVYGTQFSADEHIKKPKYLVLNAFHGSERKTVFSTYRFIRDVLKGHNVPKHFKEGAIIQVMPVANPTGFNAFEYRKTNGVDINHNFDWNWTESSSSGAYPASEPETQVITKWLTDNSNADLFIDFHNNGMVNENVAIIGTPNNDDTERVKKIALRGIDRVIPFWRDVIGYDSFVVPVMGETSITDEREEKEVIFAYSVSGERGGSAFNYAQNVLGIPGFVMETSSYYGDFDEWKANETAYPAETIAMGAEALGNILIELFESCEVVDMTETNGKIDALAESTNSKLDTILQSVQSGFREVKGQLVVNATTGADIIYANGTVDATTGDLIPVEGKSALQIKLSIPDGARIVCIKADADTEAAIKKTQTKYFVQATVDFSPIGYLMAENTFPHTLWGYNESNSKWNYVRGISSCYNTDGFNVSIARLKAGTYNWTAYYWNKS